MTKEADRESILQGFEPNCYGDGNVYRGMRSRDSETKIIYTESTKEWVGLTDEDRWELVQKTPSFDEAVAAVEAKLKEKNT